MLCNVKNKLFYKRNFENILFTVIFLILPFIFFKESFNITSILYGIGDTLSYNLPNRILLIDSIKNLQLPLWNIFNLNGFPFIGNIQAGIFYLPNIIIGLLSPYIFGYNFSIFLHYSLSGIFTYFFLKEFNLNKIASFSGGLAFMFSGFMILRKSHSPMIFVIAWLPLILLFFDKYYKEKNKKFLISIALIFSMQFFAGNPQIFLYSTFIVFLYIIFLFLKVIYKNGFKNSKYFIATFLPFVILLFLAAIQLLPTVKLITEGFRVKLSFNDFSIYSFNFRHIPMLFFPYIYGKVNPNQLPDITTMFIGNYPEMGMYLGIFPFFLTITGFFSRNKNRFFWIIISVLSLLLVFGKYLPFYKVIYFIPIFNLFRISTRFWVLYAFSSSVLAGFGIDFIINSDKREFKKAAIAVASICFLMLTGFFGFYFYFKNYLKINNPDFFNNENYLHFNINEIDKSFSIFKPSVYIPLILFAVFIIVLVFITLLIKKDKLKKKFSYLVFLIFPIFIFLDLFSFGHNFEPVINAEVFQKVQSTYYKEFEYLKSKSEPFRVYSTFNDYSSIENQILSLNGNINLIYGIQSFKGYEPLYLKDFNKLTSIDENGNNLLPWNKLVYNNNILSVSNVKLILIPYEYIKSAKLEDDYIFFKNFNEKELLNSRKVLDLASERNPEIVNEKENHIFISGNKKDLKLLNIPVNLKSDTFYRIDFKIKKAKSFILPDPNSDFTIHFDLYGVRNNNAEYDNFNQEFLFDYSQMTQDFKEYSIYFYSENIPRDLDTFIRIFCWQTGDFELKDISFSEIELKDKPVQLYGNIFVLENSNYLPRFYFTGGILNVKNIDEARDILWDQSFDPHVYTLVENYDLDKYEFIESSKNEITIVNYKNNYVDLKVKNENDGFLVFSDTFYDGWHAYIDGKETKIYKTNGLFKGIYVPEGEHNIRFRFLPKYFVISGCISGITFIILIIFLCIPNKKLKMIFNSQKQKN